MIFNFLKFIGVFCVVNVFCMEPEKKQQSSNIQERSAAVAEDFFDENNLKKGYSLISKLSASSLTFLGEESVAEEEFNFAVTFLNNFLQEKQRLDINEAFKIYKKDIPEFFSKHPLIHLQIDQTKESILNYLHKEHRGEPVKSLNGLNAGGLISGYWCITYKDNEGESKEEFFQFTTGQGILIGKDRILTAKHVLNTHESAQSIYLKTGYISRMQAKNSSINQATVEAAPMYLFCFNNGENIEKIWIDSSSVQNINEKLDLSVAQLSEETKSALGLKINSFKTTDTNFLLSVEEDETDNNKLNYYKLTDLDIYDFSQLTKNTFNEALDVHSSKYFVTKKFMKAGVSGAGILDGDEASGFSVMGIFNGKLDIKLADKNILPIFHFSPIKENEIKTIKEEKINEA